jgi:hypothetical protein
MKNLLKPVLFMFLLATAFSCNESEVAPTEAGISSASAADAKNDPGNLLKNVPVAGTTAAGAFKGLFTITEFSYDATAGLMVSGTLKGVVTTASGKTKHVSQAFSDIAATLTGGSGAAGGISTAAVECQVLFLDLGPIFLDVLGLQVDLSQVILDITAVGGSGNLVGNLLCAVTGLLDPLSGLLAILETLGSLTDLLGAINDLLGSL